ncbi:cytochrome C [Solemya pervernicosa gill symbiont]|uniref:Cbb3-type cytochrome c oxidase subunit n=2 Tax=Gammaproteobacteria incertae sedis TaxID=118884 RepID=A0A1T2L7C2_9GAMM|nr:c-type cytochrome [Candidatus Reidiella endopervernicosa]OOZ40973.1 cytochrome C [Solemya pervernicosa gill symbiont]QKQ25021.1 c-type cytochrome [Candidatus Reidiella endopervernicosa]
MSENNPFPGENNTGHIWDDNLRELLNEPPGWWRIGFHASWICVVLYTIWYPSWPLIDGHFKGVSGWTSIGEYKEDLSAIEEIRAPYEAKLQGMSAAAILADDELSSYVSASAKVLFGDNCAACHGSGGQGGPNFPVLADDDWLYGGSIDAIQASISNGRQGMMTAHGKTLSSDEVDSLAQSIVDGNVTGNALYMGKACFACHGADGKGMAALGSANLTDSIYRFAGDQLESVKYTISHGVNDPSDAETRNAVMPKFGDKLSETDIKKLAVYVRKMGGGQ